ncbi:unnamed protein product [Cylindrotheca closterium]|uniref:PCI domain-containing protein n=1 Tax=Cylindrotheca closterium TaxID=2856 RepID=A0AAD2FNN7_9STRA|nr:unnamed protein product [Cylindrotheca closterium]
MVNNQTLRQELQVAAQNHDPIAMVQVVKMPFMPNTKKGTRTQKHKQDAMMVGETDYGGLLAALLDAHSAAEAGHADDWYGGQSSVHSNFNRIFGSSEGNWLVPSLISICKNTHRIALLADRGADGPRHRNTNLQSAVQLLQDSYSKTFNDRTEYQPSAPFDTEGSKKAGVLAIVNELFGMYFKLNILRLCKNLIRPVETRKLNETGTMGQMVTYRYYIGRLNMFEDQHALAEKNLDFAFLHCHQGSPKNKRCILRYLIPIKLYRGRLPTMYLLEKYGLEEFKPLVDGLQKGDLRAFQDGLVRYQDRFIRQGTYLLLEKCKTVCYRNLFKRVHNILDKHQISLNHVAAAFKWLGLPIDLDEVECILANLIFRGYVRGYLSHTKRVLVLSKRDPFPKSAIIAP